MSPPTGKRLRSPRSHLLASRLNGLASDGAPSQYRPHAVNRSSRGSAPAINARFSSDLQRPTSTEDQVRRCREFAAHQGWSIVEEFVRFDERKLFCSPPT